MEKLKRDEVKWESVKLIENGAKGLKLKYAYLFEHEGRNFICSNEIERDVPPKDVVRDLFQDLAPIVATIESLDYIRTIVNTPSFDPTKSQIEIAEQTVLEMVEKINVTQLVIKEKKKEKGAIMKYSKQDATGDTTDHSTVWIGFSFADYGIEERLQEVTELIEVEAYRYEFEQNYIHYEGELFNQETEEVEAEDVTED